MSLVQDVDRSKMLWRYMDLSKFLDLILHKNLVFPRYDKFEDTYEGYSNNYVELLINELGKNRDKEANEFTKGILNDRVIINNYFSYVSCWHMNEFESAGMWKLYCSTHESLALKTSVGSLKDSLTLDDKFVAFFSKVNYKSNLNEFNLDDLMVDTRPFNSLLLKRESFEHEKEYRLIIVEKDGLEELCSSHQENMHREFKNYNDKLIEEFLALSPTERALREDEFRNNWFVLREDRLDEMLKNLRAREPIKRISLNVESLIHEIIVSPHAPDWFVKTLSKLVESLGYSFRVTKSDLYKLK